MRVRFGAQGIGCMISVLGVDGFEVVMFLWLGTWFKGIGATLRDPGVGYGAVSP